MCTGRVDISFVVKALMQGADGVIIGGCWPGECHYVTEGNYDALANVHICKKMMSLIGLDPQRLRIEWIAASEGSRFAEVMNSFVAECKQLGPPGQSEGLDSAVVQSRLAAVEKLIPYIKLVERERLRAPEKSEEAYNAYYASDEVNRLFSELIADKLAVSQILQILGDKPHSTREISESLGLKPSEVSRHMSVSSRQGLVRYDVEHNRYALAPIGLNP